MLSSWPTRHKYGKKGVHMKTLTVAETNQNLHTNVSSCLAEINRNTGVAIPENLELLKKYRDVQETSVKMGHILLDRSDLPSDVYRTVFQKTQEHAELLLDAELKLGEKIRSIPTAQGRRSDTNADTEIKTKKQILNTEYGLTERQASDLSKLTPESVNSAKEQARNEHRIVTRNMALQIVKKQHYEANNKSGDFHGAYSDTETTWPETPTTTNYTQLFANVGIGEFYLGKHGFISAVSNEIEKDRAEWYQEKYPSSHMVVGDFSNQQVFDELVDWHKKQGCKLILASPPCQTFSVAGKRDFNDNRTSLFLQMLNFVSAVNDVNRAVMIENVPEFLTAKPENIKELGDQNIGEYIKTKLENMGYIVNIAVINGADYDTAQARERAIILASKDGLWEFPKKDERHKMLFEVIGDLPSLEIEQKCNYHPYHNTEKIHWGEVQVTCLRNTKTGCSARNNTEHKPVNKNGATSKSQFNSAFQRKHWELPCNTITTDNGDIAGFRTVHPGRPLSDGTYTDARPLTLLELLRVTGLPDDYKFPDWAVNQSSERFIRTVIGECFLPKNVERLMSTCPGLVIKGDNDD